VQIKKKKNMFKNSSTKSITNSINKKNQLKLLYNIENRFGSNMKQLTIFCAILILNFVSCTVANSVGGGISGNGGVDTKNLLTNPDGRMLPAEVYPWNILGVPDYSVENENVKRSQWQKLHGTWGKRNLMDNNVGTGNGYHNNMENFDETNNVLNSGSVSTNGNGANNNEIDNDIDMHDGPTDRDYQELIKFEEIYSLPSSIVNDLLKPNANANSLYNEKKRAWRNLNVAWGKRRPSNEWNKFRGAWGKREPGWNNLKGLWGKRASNWNKLNSAWGKRSEDTMESLNN